MPSAWTELRAAADPVVRPYNLYTAYPLTRAEHIGTVAGSVDELREFLVDAGYGPQYLSAAKAHPDASQPWTSSDLHDLSYRRVPAEHPPATIHDGEMLRIAREFRPAECQYHVHAFGRGGVLECYSHYEVRPDFLRPSISIRRLQTHYRPEYAQDYLRGVTDLELPDAL